MSNISSIRKEYRLQSLLESDIDINPIKQFDKWWQQAIDSQIDEVNAMTLATVSKEGAPTARIVLLKEYNEEGFIFFTNYQSAKGENLVYNPKAALVFFWKELERQIRIEGAVKKISEQQSDEYFNSRPTESKLGAWASSQSQKIESREVLEINFKKVELDFKDQSIKRPPHWGGYLVVPNQIEFWQGRPGRLHDRILYSKNKEGEWGFARLAP